MNPGPAPTLLNDWVTNQAFWAFLFLAAFAGLVYYTTEFLKTWHAKSAELDQVLEQGPPAYDDTCCIQACTRPGLVPVHTVHGLRFACRQCAGIVGQWVGRGNQVYDQQLDPITDLATWDKEMDAS
jgi:hypothetical protein